MKAGNRQLLTFVQIRKRCLLMTGVLGKGTMSDGWIRKCLPFLTSGVIRNRLLPLGRCSPKDGCLAWQEASASVQRKGNFILWVETVSCLGSRPGLRNLSQISAQPHPSDEHFNTGTKMYNHSQRPCLGILAQTWILIHLGYIQALWSESYLFCILKSSESIYCSHTCSQ